MSEATIRAGRPTPEQAMPVYVRGTNYLLAIAIDKYKHFPILNNPNKDADDLIHLLVEHYEFEPSNVKQIRDEEATQDNILKALDEYSDPGRVTLNDNLIILFSGHGENRKNRGYWIPVDAEDFTDYISLGEVQNFLSNIPVRHIFLIVDSCFSGMLFKARATNNIPRVETFRSRYALTAGRDQPVSDGNPGENSPLIKGVLRSLSKREKISAVTLCQDALEWVGSITNDYQTPQHGDLLLESNENGQFYFYPKQYEETVESLRSEKETLESALITIKRQKEELATALRLAKSQTLAAKALVLKNTNPTVAIRVAEAGFKLYNNKETTDALKAFVTDESIGFYKKIFDLGYPILCIAFSPDDKTFFAGTQDKTAKLWDLSGELLQEFKGHNACVYSFAFSPNGNSILTGSEDNTAIWWDYMGNRLQDFKGHQSRVSTVAFSPSGQSILTGSDDQTVILWNIRSERLQHFQENNSYLNVAGTSTSDEDNQWKTIFAWLENGSIAPLTSEQKKEYGIEE